MVTIQDRAIDFSTFPDSDGEPMVENRANLDQMVLLIYGAERLLAPRVRFAAGGNQFIYYNRRNGREHTTPDVYVALDVAPGKRPKWETWNEEDKFPDLVMEITSVSTQDEDLGNKVRLYGRLGAREYYIYDPEQLLQPPFRAYTREGNRLVERLTGPDLRAFSPVLGAELRVVGEWLRIIDPATGEPIPSFDEEHAALHEIRAELGETQEALGQTQEALGQTRLTLDETQLALAETRSDAARMVRGMLLKILVRRFGPLPPSLDADLARLSDVARLEALVDAALDESSLPFVVQSLQRS